MTRPPAPAAPPVTPPPRDGKITRERVLAAALELIDRDGVEGCPCAASPAPSAVTP